MSTHTDSTENKKRHYRGRQEWRQILDDYDRSGLTQAAFCQQHGLALSNFHQWRRKLNNEAPDSTAFVELTPAQGLDDVKGPNNVLEHGHWLIELDLGGGRVLRLRAA